jgi:hypothetical protein
MTRLAVALTLLLVTRPLSAQDITSMQWLAGCWERRTATGITLEQWMAPAGGTMLGMSRTTRGDVTREFEFLRLVPRDGKLTYVAMPSGQQETAFAAAVVSDTAAVFENAAHDFPQRIAYHRVGADSLVARISNISGPANRVVTFAFARGSCR